MGANLKDLEKLCKALANRRRLAILKYLNGRTKASVGDIAKHLRILAACDLVEHEQQSLYVFYSLPKHKPALLKQILNLM